MNKLTFIETLAPLAVKDQKRTCVLSSITIAQACLESGYGKAGLGCNLFGIKGSGQTFTTHEYYNGQKVIVQDSFRAYENWEVSVRDHGDFLIQNGRYSRAGFLAACNALDYKAAAKALQDAGYATDPKYASKLIGIIETYELHQYDKIEEEDEFMKPVELKDWAWAELDKYVGDAYNEGIITDWSWVQQVRDRKLNVVEWLTLKTLIDERRRAK
ncbi:MULTISPECIES: glycoside hydrolase family 73 protein [Paenibacillus]|uniref:glycoside hydrolase family 73 protein n=1 Tax=Paenibacillus TaxID=44249 RepID=UPI0022B862A1|nr:glycoside hydrolase family 73 protein [Paenibacillus caseinilyticus]MCZ8520109.1 glycoside hydrolase family 73 protein [Paenibacillus caseinilyticus]